MCAVMLHTILQALHRNITYCVKVELLHNGVPAKNFLVPDHVSKLISRSVLSPLMAVRQC